MKISKLAVIVILSVIHSSAQEIEVAGGIDDLIKTEHLENDLPKNWDTRLPKPGKIRMLAEVMLGEAIKRIEDGVNSVPNGPSGKDSLLYQKILQWKLVAQEQMAANNRTTLLKLNPIQAEVIVLAKTGKDVDPSLMKMAGQIQSTGKALIYNAADFVLENENPNIEQLTFILTCFCTDSFVDESEWEEESQPIEAAGIFILNPVSIVDLLKNKSASEIMIFLGGYEDNSIFESYEEAGNGIPVIKTKYAANKAAIQAKFAEVLAHAAALEAANLEK